MIALPTPLVNNNSSSPSSAAGSNSDPVSPRSTLDNLAIGNDDNGVSSGLSKTPPRLVNPLAKKDKSNIGEKDILFGRGKSIQERPPNVHFRRFVDVFRENYESASCQADRNQIVRRIVEMLQDDGYSFLKPGALRIPTSKKSSEASATNHAIAHSDRHKEEDEIVLQDHSSWVAASPGEVHKKVVYLFRKPPRRDRSAATAAACQQQHCTALNHAIAAAIDTSSLAATVRHFPSPAPSPLFFSSLPTFTTPETSPLLQSSSQPPLHPMAAALEEQPLSLPPSNPPAAVVEPIPEAQPTSDAPEPQSHSPIPHSATSVYASQLLQQAKDGNGQPHSASVLPKDGLLWNKGTKQINLLEGMDSSIIPTTSYTLFPTAETDAFGATHATSNEGTFSLTNIPDTSTMTVEGSKTIGYTEQKVGNLTILRPIVLLPPSNNHQEPAA